MNRARGLIFCCAAAVAVSFLVSGGCKKDLGGSELAPNISATSTSFFQNDILWADIYSSESGFIVERSADGANFSEIGRTAKDATSFADQFINVAEKSYYRVRGFSGAGEFPVSNLAAVVGCFSRTYGGTTDDLASDVSSSMQRTSDGGYVVAGSTNSFGAGGLDALVLKLSENGSVQWQRVFGGPAGDVIYSIRQSSDGGYILAGYTFSFGANDLDMWMMKLNSMGDITWQKRYGTGLSNELAYSVCQASDGGFIAGGYTTTVDGSLDALLLKTDGNGNIVWQKAFTSATGIANIYDVAITTTGGIAACGSIDGDAWVLNLNADVSINWQMLYGGNQDDEFFGIAPTVDGGFAVSGYTSSFGGGGQDAWFLKLTPAGFPAIQLAMGGTANEIAYDIVETNENGFLVVGNTDSFGSGDIDAWVLDLTSTGAVNWQRTYGGLDGEVAYSVARAGDGGFAFAGYASSFGAGSTDMWLAKIPRDGSFFFGAGSAAISSSSTATPVATNVAAANAPSALVDIVFAATDTNATVTVTIVTVEKQAP